MRPDELDGRIRERLDALCPAPRAELLQEDRTFRAVLAGMPREGNPNA